MNEVKELKAISKSKSTKDVIYDALQVAIGIIESNKGQQLDPIKAMEVKKNESIVKAAEIIIADEKLVDVIHRLRAEHTVTIEELAENIEIAGTNYEEINKAIAIKKAELTELFSVEQAMLNLVAIVNAEEEARNKYAIKTNEDIQARNMELKSISDQIVNVKLEASTAIKELEANAKKERDRAKAEWDYDFARTKKAEQDKFNDELESAKKGFAAEVESANIDIDIRNKEVTARENAMEDKESYIATMEAKIVAFPGELSKAVEEAKATGKSEAEKINAIKEAAIKRELEADKKILESRLSMTELDNKKLQGTVVELTNKLDAAYKEMRDMANNITNASRPNIIQSGVMQAEPIRK